MVRFAAFLLTVAVAVGCKPSSGGLGAASNAPADKPEDAVKAFVAALNAKDDKAAQALVFMDATASTSDVLKQLPLTFTATDYKATMTEPYLAVVSYKLSTKSETGIPPSTNDVADQVSVLAVGGKWKILPGRIAFGSGSEASLGTMVSVMGMSEGFAKAKTAAQATSSLSNAKRIALGVIMYAGDCDDRYPLATNTIDGIMPYLKNRDLFTSPGDPKGSVSYSFNEKVLGTSAVAVTSPATTVLLYEGKDHKLNFAHDGKAAVAFCDGHAKLYTEEESKTLNWDPTK